MGIARYMSSGHQITSLLQKWSDGSHQALEKLTPLVYRELHRLAGQYMKGERPGHPLQPTALVNEVFLRLIDWKDVNWRNRAHFYGTAARLMRRVLVDFARRRNRAGRSGGFVRVSLEQEIPAGDARDTDLVALDEALERLAETDPRKSEIVELRFFGGFGVEETAKALKLSTRTVMREWSFARAWLYRELGGS